MAHLLGCRSPSIHPMVAGQEHASLLHINNLQDVVFHWEWMQSSDPSCSWSLSCVLVDNMTLQKKVNKLLDLLKLVSDDVTRVLRTSPTNPCVVSSSRVSVVALKVADWYMTASSACWRSFVHQGLFSCTATRRKARTQLCKTSKTRGHRGSNMTVVRKGVKLLGGMMELFKEKSHRTN